MVMDELKSKFETANRGIGRSAEAIGNFLVGGFHYLALFAIGGSVVWSAGFTFIAMVGKGRYLSRILLLGHLPYKLFHYLYGH